MRHPSSSADGAGGWGSFPDTVLYFRSSPEIAVDLRADITRSSLQALRGMGFERSFGIVTAQDPMGRGQLPAVNAALAASLQEETAELGVARVCVDACSPDRAHCERSVAIALDEASLVDIAYRYEQLAIFWFDGEAFWIVPVHSRNERMRLPALI